MRKTTARSLNEDKSRRLATVFAGALVLYFVLYSPSYRFKKAYDSKPTTVIPEPLTSTSQPPTQPLNLSPSPPAFSGDSSPVDQSDHQSDHPPSFRNRQDWYFEVDPFKVFDPLGPKPENVIILTAGDGGGNNAEIPDLLENVSQNRQEYCDYQGYICVFTNITKYDIEGYHPVWGFLSFPPTPSSKR